MKKKTREEIKKLLEFVELIVLQIEKLVIRIISLAGWIYILIKLIKG